MGKSSGSRRQKDASASPDARDSSPLDGILPCKPPVSTLKVILRRCDKPEKLGSIAVHAEKPPKLNSTSAAGSGIADFGTVEPGSYTVTTTLTPAQRKKYRPAKPTSVSVAANEDVQVTVCLPPVVRLKIVLFGLGKTDRKDAKIQGAHWELPDGLDHTSGDTGADGLIDVEIPADADKVELSVTLPDTPADFVTDVPADAAAPTAGTKPPYPVKLRHTQFVPDQSTMKRMPIKLKFAIAIADIEEGESTDAAEARLRNLGYRWQGAPLLQRAVVAYQKRYLGAPWDGSGAIGDIQGDLKGRHDNV